MERRPLQLTPSAASPVDEPVPHPFTLRELVRAYPKTVVGIVRTAWLLVAVDGLALSHLRRYRAEIARLRAGMTNVERQRADALVAGNQNHLRLTIEMLRRQARGDQTPHLTISVDSGLMYFAREGATLREMAVESGPERT